MKKRALSYLEPLVFFCVIGGIFQTIPLQGALYGPQSEDEKIQEKKREDQRVENQREEKARQENRIQESRLEDQRLENQRIQRKLDDERWERQHGR